MNLRNFAIWGVILLGLVAVYAAITSSDRGMRGKGLVMGRPQWARKASSAVRVTRYEEPIFLAARVPAWISAMTSSTETPRI